MHMGVDGTGDAVHNFDVQLWDCVFCMARSVWDGTHADGERHAGVHTHIADVAHCGALDHVADSEAFNCLVLGDTA